MRTVARTAVAMALCVGLVSCNLGGPRYEAAKAVDLGDAVYPVGASSPSPARHQWVAQINPSSYRLSYALDAAERASTRDSLESYARSVGYAQQPDKSFMWHPSRDCVGDMHCAYNNIAGRGVADLEPLVERFRARQRAANLRTDELAALIVTFVQNIRYEEPKDMPFGVLPPALVVAEQRGDCDSKSLLGHMLLRAVGIDSVLVSSRAHHHAMLAIALPATGTKVTYNGRDYAFTEMTAKGSPIGHMNSSLRSPNDWKVVMVSYSTTPAITPTTSPKPLPPPKPPPKRR